MKRLARLLPFRQFYRLRYLRGLAPCPSANAKSRVEVAAQPAFGRMPLRASLSLVTNASETASTRAVRVYRSPSRVVMVGHIDAICRMLDRCIAREGAGADAGWFDRV